MGEAEGAPERGERARAESSQGDPDRGGGGAVHSGKNAISHYIYRWMSLKGRLFQSRYTFRFTMHILHMG